MPSRHFDPGMRAELELLIIQGGRTNVQLAEHFSCDTVTITREKKKISRKVANATDRRISVLEAENRRLRVWTKKLGNDRSALRLQVEELGATPRA